ncbi:ribonuclease P protein component [Winogradskyella aurantia]|uniref:Ribonuclease P protein component n=1 Tax=Winogradskyella aurantia TaxID=1915063 RepID=A0A265UZX6_9FLAO|nr:ribonuclease P protein component [Winogradskyella aurantia]OZV70864.1 ribonuclease P protein component [Winogradskyella aurantia]
MSYRFSKKDKLKSKKIIERLFNEGQSITVFPLRLIYLKTPFDDNSTLKTGVSVSKRLHKNAVSRNRIKRLMREAFRLNKPNYFNNSSTAYALMILYISKDTITFEAMDKTVKKMLQKFLDKTANK